MASLSFQNNAKPLMHAKGPSWDNTWYPTGFHAPNDKMVKLA
jgi:hypothetical protein